MGLFGDKEAKREEKLKKVMEKYHLEDVSPTIAPQIQDIAYDLAGNDLIAAGELFQGNAVESTKLDYLAAITKQNFIIIKLLDQIANK
ncbi:hypothetical protein [Pseudobutyrivibrio sp.]|uniref:hypothetical protein n=1 Tax=Pseudobutyrivibrio sp. TaxID=2014367 RepID=UPI00386522C4